MSLLLKDYDFRLPPELIAGVLERVIPQAQTIVTRLPAFTYAVIAARGSSDHAGRATTAIQSLRQQYVVSRFAGVPATSPDPLRKL